jgi:hypothetical protein
MYTEELLEIDPYPKEKDETRLTESDMPIRKPEDFIDRCFWFSFNVKAWIELENKCEKNEVFAAKMESESAQTKWVIGRTRQLHSAWKKRREINS